MIVIPIQTSRCIADVVKHLQKNIDKKSVFEMVVSRDNIFNNAIRRMKKLSFDPQKKLKVRF